ncbi:MAG: hypothetical protein RL329_447 [Bacteroidota bacterium]
MIRIMKLILFFLLVISFSRCDINTTHSPVIWDRTMQPDTSDLAISIVYSSTLPAYGLELISKNRSSPIRIQKIIFSGNETNYKAGCEDMPHSGCNSQYCYLPTYGSASRLAVSPMSETLTKPVCTVYYRVGGKAKRAIADSVSITPCEITAPPGINMEKRVCYWLRGCND